MTNLTVGTTQEDMIKEYIQFVITNDVKGAGQYLEKHFTNADGSANIKDAQTFVEKVMTELNVINTEDAAKETTETVLAATEANEGVEATKITEAAPALDVVNAEGEAVAAEESKAEVSTEDAETAEIQEATSEG